MLSLIIVPGAIVPKPPGNICISQRMSALAGKVLHIPSGTNSPHLPIAYSVSIAPGSPSITILELA